MTKCRTYPSLVKLTMREGMFSPRPVSRDDVVVKSQHNVIDGILLASILSVLIWGAVIFALI